LLEEIESLSKIDQEIQELDKRLEVFDGLPDVSQSAASLACAMSPLVLLHSHCMLKAEHVEVRDHSLLSLALSAGPG